MVLDERLEFADATAINTGGAANYLIGDVIDLGPAHRDIGVGEPLFLVITVDTALLSATGTISFALVSDAQAAIATDGTATEHYRTKAALQAAVVAGVMVAAVALPMEGPVYERYLGILQTTAVAAFTAGKINAFLTHDVAKWAAYADGSN